MKRMFVLICLAALSGAAAQTPEEAVRFLDNGNGVGARALSLGGAYTAAANDYSAIYWNPACLTLLRNSELSVDMYYQRFQNEAEFAGSTTLQSENFTAFKSAGMAYRFPTTRGSLVLAFGYNRFKDMDDFLSFSGFNTLDNGLTFDLENDEGQLASYPYNTNVQQGEVIRENGHLGAWSLGGGMALSPSFSMGVTFSGYSGSSAYDFLFEQDDVEDGYNQFPANYNHYEVSQYINSSFTGWATRIGGLFELNNDLRMGFSVDLPFTLRVNETYSSTDALLFDDDYLDEMDLGSGEWEYLVRYPASVSGGVALDLDRLLLTASCSYRDWTKTKFAIPSGMEWDSDYDDLIFENVNFTTDFRPVLSYGFGAELRVPGSGLSLRGGYRLVPSPLYDADETLDREYITAGLGFRMDPFTTFHLTYVKGTQQRYSMDSYTPGGTSETIRTDRVMAGLTYRLTGW